MIGIQKGGSGSYEKDAPKKTSFKEAFASARADGEKTFEWNGKKYTTELAKPKAAPKAEAAAPKVDAVSRHSDLKKSLDAIRSKGRPATPGPITKAMTGDDMPSVPAMPKSRMASGKITSMEDEQPKAFAKGGSVSGRADGIAKKGKTNCKMV